MRSTLSAFQKGYAFEPTSIELTPAWVDEYVAAVEDAAVSQLGNGAVPPMALAAISIYKLLEQSGLPEGAIHVGQELAFTRPVRTNERVSVQAEIASRGERQGWALMAIALKVQDESGSSVMEGRATITFPVEIEGAGQL
jgi:acyl dehydratase